VEVVVRDRIRPSVVFVRSFALGAPLFALACAPKAAPPKAAPEEPFAISDYYAPSGAMGDGATPGNLIIETGVGCKDRPANARGSCYRFQYVANSSYTTPINKSTGVCNWAGLAFQYPDNNWGTSPGLLVPVSKLTKLTFKVAVAAGTELVNFQMGGIGAPPLADGGPAPPPPGACPPAETPAPPNYDILMGASTQQVGTDWLTIEIPIAGRDPSVPLPAKTNLIGALSWGIPMTPALPKTIYMDDLFFE
jgi:hypothetical protein